MDTVPARRSATEASSRQLAAWLVGIVEGLDGDTSPLSRALAEMIRVRDGDIAVLPSLAALELMQEPTTPAEQTAARFLTAIAVHARDTRLDDKSLSTLMRFGAVCTARFDSYLVERSTG